jgi:hypothetical protein
MMAARRFPFGDEPASAKAERTELLPLAEPQTPDPQKTELLADFKPPTSTLPFCAPLLPPLLPPPHPSVPPLWQPLSQPLVPPPPPRAPARAPFSLRNAAAMVLLVLDIAVLLYLAVTWRP